MCADFGNSATVSLAPGTGSSNGRRELDEASEPKPQHGSDVGVLPFAADDGAPKEVVQQLPPLRSVHTNTFPQILAAHGSSLAVTTYQAGKLVLLRADQSTGAAVLNTHFRNFNKPMGFAWEPGRFALGTNAEIWEFHDLPAVASKLPSKETSNINDAVFLPRHCHFTGDIQVHEMLWVPHSAGGQRQANSELWFINTRFSCLATRSGLYSFVPRWRPPFITALSPEDRCHLNGCCLRDGRIRYMTALGETNAAGSWRDTKAAGGIVIDIQSNQIIARGLSMPHSPRWRNGKLWVLESGRGGLGTIDEHSGRYQEVCRLPGFTRGLDFAGSYAFVGLSQVRESAVFSGIPVADLPENERMCGVWIVDLRTGTIAGFVKFTDAVQEVFAVQALANTRWPDVLNEGEKQISESYELPDEALRDVPKDLHQ